MKKLLVLALSLLSIHLSAQELGVHAGMNINRYSVESNIGLTSGFSNSVSAKIGKEFAISYRMQLNHAWSFEPSAWMITTKAALTRERIEEGKLLEQYQHEIEESFFGIQPNFYYNFHNQWAFIGGAGFRFSRGGQVFDYHYPYDPVKNTTAADPTTVTKKIDPFEFNYMDMILGVQYETKLGLGAYVKYQYQIMEFQKPYSDILKPVGTVSFGINFRIHQDRLSKYKR
jgi:hypothetical protein